MPSRVRVFAVNGRGESFDCAEKEFAVNEKGRDQSQAELDAMELKAPRQGLVTRAFKRTGEGSQSGEKIVEIVATRRIRVEFDVLAATAARLRVGMPVIVSVQPPTSHEGKDLDRYPTVLKFIDPTIGQVSRKVRVWAELDNSEGKLREGLAATVEIRPESVAAPAGISPPAPASATP